MKTTDYSKALLGDLYYSINHIGIVGVSKEDIENGYYNFIQAKANLGEAIDIDNDIIVLKDFIRYAYGNIPGFLSESKFKDRKAAVKRILNNLKTN